MNNIHALFQPSSLPPKPTHLNAAHTYVVPSIQYGLIGAKMDEIIYHSLLENMRTNFYDTTLTTGYMNYPLSVLKLLNNFESNLELITSTPFANSFFTDKKWGAMIPRFYTAVY